MLETEETLEGEDDEDDDRLETELTLLGEDELKELIDETLLCEDELLDSSLRLLSDEMEETEEGLEDEELKLDIDD